MKHKTIAFSLALLLLLAGCGQSAQEAATPEHAESAISDVATPEEIAVPQTTATPTATLQPTPTPTEQSVKAVEPQKTDAPVQTPSATAAPKAEQPTPAPTELPAAAPVSLSCGAIPFELAASDGTWWQIDSTDSAYWAVQENINAIRAAGGLGALSMSDSLSASAGTRCESFVAGGAFDHSGMITKSEICASGPIGSASKVCTAWQGSPDHYANIMRTDISSMGVACWFCSVDGNNYTYWVVTFE
ncbi:MAG: CAP domain-containing protein [Oscillospiraceae bacterium]|nr:CAP domain-containing protein [Oscillospiraceae bacterium]